jgi:hypothetical protein
LKNIPQFGDPPLFAGPGFANKMNGSSVYGGSVSDCAEVKLKLQRVMNTIRKKVKKFFIASSFFSLYCVN